jgi:hypothetical protein
MARGVRCLIGMHKWAKHVVEGAASLECTRCGKTVDGPVQGVPVNPSM